jgi:type IV pilus assembly protein PilM
MKKKNLLENIFFANSMPLGLDIGSFSVKMAQVKTSSFSKKMSLSFSLAPVRGDKSREKVIEAIKEAYRNLGADTKKVNISIYGQNIVMRYVVLPSMTKEDLHKSLEFELEKYIPYKKEDAVIEYYKLANLSDSKMIVLLVAALRRSVIDRVNLVKEAGLEPQSVNVDALVLSETIKTFPTRTKGVVALLDVGHRFSKLVVMENDVPYFSRDVITGEYNIMQAISNKLGVTYDNAKELGCNPGDKLDEITKAITYELNSLVDELSLSFEYCDRNLEKKVTRLFLTGGGSKVKILSEYLKKIPNLKIEFLDPVQNFKISSSIRAEDAALLKEYSSLLSVAVGLALG